MTGAQQLLSGAVYDPQTMRSIFSAFDEVWQAIAQGYRPDEVETARTRLANIILDLAAQGERDPEAMKDAALRLMSLPGRAGSGP